MKRSCFVAVFLAALFGSSACLALAIGEGRPKIVVYQPSATQVVVYDARPELGLAMRDVSKRARGAASDLGIRLVRHTLYWNKMETTDKPGLYDSKYLGEWNALVETCRKEGLYLVVVIDGIPPAPDSADLSAAYHRLALFAADMAARYPSVMFWELLGESSPSTDRLPHPLSFAPSQEGGRDYAEMLKVVYPAVKAANPTAHVLAAAGTEDFARGIYQSGAKNYFDILSVTTGVPQSGDEFAAYGQRIGATISEFDDDHKPVWNTIIADADGNVSLYKACFGKNNRLNLYQKVFLCVELDGDVHQSPVYGWLADQDVNRAILNRTTTVRNIFVPTDVPIAPLGYRFNEVEDGIEIQRVVVETLAPTRIDLMFLGEPRPLKPGEKPAPKKRKGTRPIPDPFDI